MMPSCRCFCPTRHAALNPWPGWSQARSCKLDVAATAGLSDDQSIKIGYFVTIRRVGVTVLVGAIGEIENVSQVFHPAGRLSAANSP